MYEREIDLERQIKRGMRTGYEKCQEVMFRGYQGQEPEYGSLISSDMSPAFMHKILALPLHLKWLLQ